jgi:LPXTG-motif cell wall-anchored protein
MKRVDRRQELKRDRFSLVTVWGAIACLLAGVALLSTGHDENNFFLSALGIVVLLSGGVLLFSPRLLGRRKWESPEYARPWRARFRRLLAFGVVTCFLVMAGFLIYGLEYGEVVIVQWGILVMWLGVGLFVPFVFIAPSKVIGPVHINAVHLSVSDLSDARGLGLEWPADKPGLWIGLYDLNIVRFLDTRFLLANMPEGHRIFLAVFAWAVKDEHKALKDLLDAAGDPYREEFDKVGGEEWHTIFASTRSEDVIREIFEGYEEYYGTYGSYPFVVGKGELDLWMDSLRRLNKRGLKGMTREMIENSYCVMVTDWDHGMEMLTNKIPEESILKVAKEIATERSLPLLNIADGAAL